MAQRHASAPKFAARALADEPVALPAVPPPPPQLQQQPAENEQLPPKSTTWPWQRPRCAPPRCLEIRMHSWFFELVRDMSGRTPNLAAILNFR